MYFPVGTCILTTDRLCKLAVFSVSERHSRKGYGVTNRLVTTDGYDLVFVDFPVGAYVLTASSAGWLSLLPCEREALSIRTWRGDQELGD